jgi:hypothetical protein
MEFGNAGARREQFLFEPLAGLALGVDLTFE